MSLIVNSIILGQAGLIMQFINIAALLQGISEVLKV